MSDVDLLRRAAALMRERAETCIALGSKHEEPWYRTGQPHVMTTTWVRFEEASPEDSEHIAAWDPAVALAVADWLDLVAETPAFRAFAEGRAGSHVGKNIRAALAVARAYLRGA